MSNEIVTGRSYASSSQQGSWEGKQASMLFDPKSTIKLSHVVSVPSCSALKISTFGLPNEVHLKVHRVFTGGGKIPEGMGCMCVCEDGNTSKVLLSEPLKIDCKEVRIDNCTGVLFLTIPGDYMFEVSDNSALGQFVAFAEEVDCCCLPTGLIIGNNMSSNTMVGTVRS